MLEFTDAVLGYSSPAGGVVVTRPLTFAIASSGVTGIVGASGGGKSTVLKAAAGLLPPISGSVQRLTAEQGGLWYMPQIPELIPFRDGIENALFGLELSQRLQIRDVMAASDLLTHLKLPTGLGPPAELSGGMRRRLALAQAVLSPRRLMLLDEALAGLDYENRLAVEAVIWRSASEGRACLLATHDMDSVVALADHVIVLRPPSPVGAEMVDIGASFGRLPQSPTGRRAHPKFADVVADLQRTLWAQPL